jgi:4-amino-4-deoxy-L-arabinose transferase-like glycosyltransferase
MKFIKTFGKLNLFKDYKWWVGLMLVLVIALGLAARLFDLGDMPLDFHPTRQLHSMLIARGMYYEKWDEAPEWQQNIAVGQWKAEGQIEPPIMERLSALGYQWVGDADLRIPRLLSIFFWTMGGIGLFLLLRNIVGGVGAVIGVAYYMLLPYTAIASRSFQPEPLMTSAIIWSWWGVTKWVKNRTWLNAVLAGVFSGLALFVKLPAIFFIVPVILGGVLINRKFKDVIADPQVWVMAILTILPFAIYHVDGFFISGFLKKQTNFRFFPKLWFEPYTYLRWEMNIDKVFVLEMFLAGLFGTLLIKDKKFRIMYLGVFLGYFLYGLSFSYHIMSHDYYQIPLTPAIAVGLAAVGGVLAESIKGKGRKLFSMIVLAGLLAFWLAVNFHGITNQLEDANYGHVSVLYESLGDKIREYTVVSITPDYGYRLSYWGWKTTRNWMSAGDFQLRELAGQDLDPISIFQNTVKDADLFLVTNFSELNRQPDVKEILEENYPVFDKGERYIIYDLRETN